MIIKVVYNTRHGGFSISQECAQYMAKRGSEEAQKMLDEFPDPGAPEGWVDCWYGHWDGERHDPVLVEAVETLGFGSSDNDYEHSAGNFEQTLQLHTLKHGTRYIVKEYDGLESVIEPEDMRWIDARPPRQLPLEGDLSLEMKI